MKYSKDTWAESAIKKRGGIRPEKKPEPKLDMATIFYWQAFRELNSARNELGPIPWTAMNDYCYRWGINKAEEFDSFCFFIRGIDSAYLKIKNKELEDKRNSKGKK